MTTSRTPRRVRSQWPPAPCVEEEPQSLSRELNGLSKIGDKPGTEGVHAKGAVDQYPIIVSVNSSPPPSTSPGSTPSMPSLGHVSSDDSSGPTTPPLQQPVIRNTVRFEDEEPPKHMPQRAASQQRGPPRSQAQQPKREPSVQGNSRPPSHHRESRARETHESRDSHDSIQSRPTVSARHASSQASRGAPVPETYRQSKPSVGRSNSARYAPSVPPRPMPERERFRRETDSGYMSDSATTPNRPLHQSQVHVPTPTTPIRPLYQYQAPVPAPVPAFVPTPVPALTPANRPLYQYQAPAQAPRPLYQPQAPVPAPTMYQYQAPVPAPRPLYQSQAPVPAAVPAPAPAPAPTPVVQAPVPTAPVMTLPNGPTLAERIEEKLRQRQERQEQRDPGSMSDPETQQQPAAKPLNLNVSALRPVPAAEPHSPIPAHEHVPSHRAQSQDPASRSRAQSVTVPPTRSMSSSRPPQQRPMAEMIEKFKPAPPLVLSQVKSGASPQSQQVNPSAQPTTRRPSVSPPRQNSERSLVPAGTRHPGTSPQRPVNLGLSPCPRTIAVAGYKDWYTLKELTHLDICPSCMGQLAKTRYKEHFIPSAPKPENQKTRCAFANAWTRLAWAQMIKEEHTTLEILYQMTRPPPGSKPCPGRVVAEQTWYRIYDPETKSDLPRFHICGSCARNVRILMPAHKETFTRAPEPKERVCDFVTSSPRFVKFIDLLDAAASRAKEERTRRPDLREFLSYARRKVVLRDCRRDRPALSTWHYIPSLPEMCICEDCYDEVVWPLVKQNYSLARKVTRDLRILPGDGPGRTREASCQLYSPRMRAKFREAVERGDLEGLTTATIRRVEAERRFLDRKEELLESQEKGYECDEEMRKAVDEWRRWE
ncbi:uncharacterized protein N7529_001393 [Penicillium soppii]|uniref:uncharacterized protein n=1 Tax=Penicillium soppii TaxID=69789 RepID=UPI00254914D7|nr:uncharacterized protein N7529_001393 [Penicillium soppii]KAJ5875809.1 hypothetical protein N7529_001393 [Penicillium soppii]